MRKLLWILPVMLLLILPAMADTVRIPASATVIADGAFAGNTSLTEVVIPDTVTTIGSRAFADTGLQAVTIAGDPDIADDAFEGCGTTLAVTVPSGSAAEAYFSSRFTLKERVYGAGTYTVGTDIPANVYIIRANTGATATVTVGSIARTFTGSMVLRVKAGETLVLRSATAVVDYEFDQNEGRLTAYKGHGMLRVGTDIEPGSYAMVLSGSSQGKVVWYSDDRLTVARTQLVDSAWLAAGGLIELADGDLIEYTDLRFSGGDGVITRRALLIAQTYSGTSYALKGTVSDASGLRSLLNSLKSTAYTCTLSTDLTASGILSAITSCFADADDDDVSLLYYSGHGYEGGMLVGTDMSGVTPARLRSTMDTISGTKVLLVDCCYSGGLLGSGIRLFASSEGVPAQDYPNAGTAADAASFVSGFNSAFYGSFSARSDDAFNEAPYYVITACAADEVSYEKYDSKTGKTVGIFTYYLCYGAGWDSLNSCALGSRAADNGDGQLTLS